MNIEHAFFYFLVALGAIYAIYHVVTGIADGKRRLTKWMNSEQESPALLEAKKVKATRQGVRRMLWGGAAFVLGALATVASYSESISSGGGSYRIFAGLMAVGGVYALVGLVQYIAKWDLN